MEAGEIQVSFSNFARIAMTLEMTSAEVWLLLQAAAYDVPVTPSA